MTQVQPLSIRHAADGDADALAAIYNHAVLHTTATFDLEPLPAEERRRWLASSDTLLVLVATSGSDVVGWASLVSWSERGAYVATAEASVYVAPAAQRTGAGLALASGVLEEAPALGLHAVIAQICAENVAGLALAERLGFERAGLLREVGHKFGRVLDVVILERLV